MVKFLWFCAEVDFFCAEGESLCSPEPGLYCTFVSWERVRGLWWKVTFSVYIHLLCFSPPHSCVSCGLSPCGGTFVVECCLEQWVDYFTWCRAVGLQWLRCFGQPAMPVQEDEKRHVCLL